MKRIILSDRGTTYVDRVLEDTDWEISLLVIDDFGHHAEKYKGNNRIRRIVTLSEIYNYKDHVIIDFRKMRDSLHLFNVGDYGSRRIKDDIYFSHYSFYSSYCFWDTFLDRNSVDFCIIVNTIHGFSSDYLLQEVSLKRKVLCYNIFYHFYDKYAVYMCNDDKLLPNENDLKAVDLSEIASYENRISYDEGILELPHGKYLNILYKLFGSYGVRLASFVVKGSYPIHYRQSSFKSYLHTLRHIKKIEKYVNTLYKKPCKDEKYFIFFLHFEPEAVLTGNTEVVDSQLFYIRMLSQSLPSGVTLYVKEHPDLYRLKRWILEYHVPVMETFYTRFFYETICSFENVKLIDYHIPANELIDKAQGISTIAGTVMSEAITLNKPIIMFAGRKHLYSYWDSVFCPQSSSEMDDAIKKILDGFVPNYDGIESFANDYLFDRSIVGEKQAIKSIEKHSMERNK